jgi:hypothetical protein
VHFFGIGRDPYKQKALSWTGMVTLTGLIFLPVCLIFKNGTPNGANEIISGLVRAGAGYFFALSIGSASGIDFFVEKKLLLDDNRQTGLLFALMPAMILAFCVAGFIGIAECKPAEAMDEWRPWQQCFIVLISMFYAYRVRTVFYKAIGTIERGEGLEDMDKGNEPSIEVNYDK